MTTFAWSEESADHLGSCHHKLVLIFTRVLLARDCSVICGHRGEAEQNRLLHTSPPRTRLQFPNSLHNREPSRAVDVIPHPFAGWDDLVAFREFGAFVMGVAHGLHVGLEWGGDWETFKDYPHFQLMENEK